MANRVKNAFLIAALVCSIAHFAILLLSLFSVINISGVVSSSFNYFLAFALIALCLGLFTLSLFVEGKKNLIVPTWLSCAFYLSFFVFTNIYYFFGLYSSIWFTLLFYLVLAVLVSVLSLSIYFNELKALDGTLQNKNRFLGVTLFSISTAISAIIVLVISFIKYLVNTHSNLTVVMLASFGILILVSLISSIVFAQSVKKTKRIANACLIKVNKTK